MSSAGPKVTLQELAAISTQVRCELVQGELVHLTPAGGIHGEVESEVTSVLKTEGRGLGKVYSGDVGIIVNAEASTVRGADNAFITNDQFPVRYSAEGYLITVPALIVEVLSPNDRASEVQEKVMEYLSAGARVVWVVDPANRTVTVHQPGIAACVLTGNDVLRAPGVIPDMRTKVEVLFAGLD